MVLFPKGDYPQKCTFGGYDQAIPVDIGYQEYFNQYIKYFSIFAMNMIGMHFNSSSYKNSSTMT